MMSEHFKKELAIKRLTKSKTDIDLLFEQIKSGNKYGLSKSITLIESTLYADFALADDLVQRCLPLSGKSTRIGITGVPGVGKSTFIEQFGLFLCSKGHKVAVLAIDPSSSQSGGSILGDKTRMEALGKEPNAFIRPSATRNSLGGVARKTRESMLLCEAAGFNVILIETVGVGQSETTVESMVDFFLLLLIGGAGDELQGIKRGIVELADALVVNKSDGDNLKRAKMARLEYLRALSLYPDKYPFWKPAVLNCSALENTGIEQVWNLIEDFMQKAKENEMLKNKRAQQAVFWMHQTIKEQLLSKVYENPLFKENKEVLEREVKNGTLSPYKAAEQLLSIFNDKKLI